MALHTLHQAWRRHSELFGALPLVLLRPADQHARCSQNVYRAHNMTGWGRDRNAMCPSGQATAENGAACDASNRAYVDASSHSWTGVTCNRAGNVRDPSLC